MFWGAAIQGAGMQLGIRYVPFGGCAALAAAIAFAAPVAAQIQEQGYKFEIPAQSLGGALRAFAQAANQQIIYSDEMVRNLRSTPLVGTFHVDDGLQTLLAGSGLVASRTPAGVLVVSAPRPETPSPVPIDTAVRNPDDVVVVTGSRIRTDETTTATPVTSFSASDISERGYTQAGQMLNQVTSNAPSYPVSLSQGLFVLNAGRHSPNLFNLGPGRTLTLLNGRRMVTSSSGLGDRIVDSNVIPVGLIERADIVQAGGAAVYGSDAIAGVVNYVLKSDFEGLVLDAQYGISSRGDYELPSLRLTAGANFADDKGNIATNVEWSQTESLFEIDRPSTASSPRTITNPENAGNADGIPPLVWISNARDWSYNRNGVIFGSYANGTGSLLTAGDDALQFSPDGRLVVPYDAGLISGTDELSIGGEGQDLRELSSLAAGVERYSASVVGHYDFTSGLRLSSEFVYGREEAVDPYGTQSILRFVGGSVNSGQGPIAFDRENPYLTVAAISTLDAVSPVFAAGGDLFLSKFLDVLPSRARTNDTDTWRALVALEGEISALDRDFYWSLSLSRGETKGRQQVMQPWRAHLNNALNSVRLPSGEIVCAINADADIANDEARCAPINPFGDGVASTEARKYVSALSGFSFTNIQDDLLATLGGDLVQLPGGTAKFSVAYENRHEDGRYYPFQGDLDGIFFSGVKAKIQGGSYRTDEFSGELLLPLLGEAFTLPLAKAFELSATYRIVDHSSAGKEDVWGTGLRWDTGLGLTLRGSRSRNFRAPTLDQQFAPQSISTTFIGIDPCDADRINGGPRPAVRLANCQADWAANPGRDPLATFQDPAENTSITVVTTGGNPELRNEVSDTTTWGFVYEPGLVPGFTLTADRVEVDLKGALSAFGPATFLSICYDSDPQPADVCSSFNRDARGVVVAAKQTTFNTGYMIYEGEVYGLNYRLPLDRIFAAGDWGTLQLGLEATHTARLETSTTGLTRTRSDGTTGAPDWRTRFDIRYTRGPLRLFYSMYYLPEAKSGYFDTIETTPNPVVGSNATHTLSVQYDVGAYTLRAGINNLTDEEPSFPTRGYGDILGRQFFVGVRTRF